jgi:hypothetical protein
MSAEIDREAAAGSRRTIPCTLTVFGCLGRRVDLAYYTGRAGT